MENLISKLLMDAKTKVVNIRNVPVPLHREAKSLAAKEGKSLQDWLIEAIREKVERNKT